MQTKLQIGYNGHNANIIYEAGTANGVASMYGVPMHRGVEEIDERHAKELNRTRLLVSAHNSYLKHCGDNAVSAAEADLLGEALEALRMIERSTVGDSTLHNSRLNKIARSVLAKADGGKP